VLGIQNPKTSMLLKTITLKYSPALDGFPDDGLRDFLAHHQVFSKRQYFYFYQGVPHLTFVLSYEGRVAGEDPKESAGAERTTAEDWKAQLSEADYTLFNALRSWRNQLCRKEGMPPYLLSTNEQLAEICRLRPTTLQALGSVRGFGESKVALRMSHDRRYISTGAYEWVVRDVDEAGRMLGGWIRAQKTR